MVKIYDLEKSSSTGEQYRMGFFDFATGIKAAGEPSELQILQRA